MAKKQRWPQQLEVLQGRPYPWQDSSLHGFQKPPTSKWSNLIWDPQPTDRSSFGATGKGGKGGKGRGACLRSGPVKGTKPQFGGWKVISIETPFLHFLWLKIKYIKCMNKTINQNSVTSLFALNFWFRCSDWCHANVFEGYIWMSTADWILVSIIISMWQSQKHQKCRLTLSVISFRKGSTSNYR